MPNNNTERAQVEPSIESIELYALAHNYGDVADAILDNETIHNAVNVLQNRSRDWIVTPIIFSEGTDSPAPEAVAPTIESVPEVTQEAQNIDEEEEETFANECDNCGDGTNNTNHTVYNRHDNLELWCDSCLENSAHMCSRCDTLYDSDALRFNDSYDSDVCSECYDLIQEEQEEENEDEDEDEYGERKGTSRFMYNNTRKTNVTSVEGRSDVQGKFIPSTAFCYSFEIECILPKEKEKQEIAFNKLPKSLGIVTDGSIRGSGIEFVSPILQGKKGEAYIKKVCKILNDNGFTVNSSCGLHVHLSHPELWHNYDDAVDDTYENSSKRKELSKKVRAIMAMYLVSEPVIFSMMPRSRRINRFCDALGNGFSLYDIFEKYDIDEIEALYYKTQDKADRTSRKNHKYDSARYYGLNMHSFFGNGHLETRYHSGTINAEKILYWTAFNVSIMQYAMDNADYMGASSLKTTQSLTNLKERTEKILSMLSLSSECKKYIAKRQKMFTPAEMVDDTEQTPSEYQSS